MKDREGGLDLKNQQLNRKWAGISDSLHLVVRRVFCWSMPVLQAAPVTHLLESAESGHVWLQKSGCVHHHLWDFKINLGLGGFSPPCLGALFLSSSSYNVLTLLQLVLQCHFKKVFVGGKECLCPNSFTTCRLRDVKAALVTFWICCPFPASTSLPLMRSTFFSPLGYSTVMHGIAFYMPKRNK